MIAPNSENFLEKPIYLPEFCANLHSYCLLLFANTQVKELNLFCKSILKSQP